MYFFSYEGIHIFYTKVCYSIRVPSSFHFPWYKRSAVFPYANRPNRQIIGLVFFNGAGGGVVA